jgi:predicted PurR-regulated permease PerM
LTGSIIVSIIICGRYILIQQLEEYFILPRVVGSRVSLNVLVSIISIVARGMLWGVAGIFLAIPIMGVVEMLLEKHGRKVSILLNNKKTEQQ